MQIDCAKRTLCIRKCISYGPYPLFTLFVRPLVILGTHSFLEAHNRTSGRLAAWLKLVAKVLLLIE